MSLNAITTISSFSKLTLPVAVFGMMLGLTACSDSSTTEGSGDTEAPASTEADVATSDAKADTENHTVTIYSSRNEQLIKPLLDRYTEKTGVKVELVTDSIGPLLAVKSRRPKYASRYAFDR